MAKKNTLPAVKEAAGLPAEWQEIMAQKAARARERAVDMPVGAGGKGLSFRGGTMSLGGEEIGHETNVIIAAWTPERTFFEGDYDPDKTAPPRCYSYDGVKPHADVIEPPSDACKGCPNNVFGSARMGKGKACKEGRRLAVIAADKDPQSDTPVYTARISTMNVGPFTAYEALLENAGKTLMDCVTKLTCVSDKKTQYKLGFSWLRKFVPKDPQGYLALLSRAEAEVLKPYPQPKASEPAQVKGPVRKSRM